ncbi:unnamed protein product [Rhizophagus irregularis]|nr:unnamed protein product [Rhizophagus irregularis]
MEKDPIRAREFLTWIQKAIPEKFTFLQKNKSGKVNVNPINLVLAKHGITSNKLRKIACRQVVGRDESVQHYGIMNDPPSCNYLKESGDRAKIKEKMD